MNTYTWTVTAGAEKLKWTVSDDHMVRLTIDQMTEKQREVTVTWRIRALARVAKAEDQSHLVLDEYHIADSATPADILHFLYKQRQKLPSTIADF